MARAWIISEALPGCDPAQGGPTYFFSSFASLTSYFEGWYVNENYLCIDDEGVRWRLFLHDTGISAEIAEHKSAYKELFMRWFKEWLLGSGERKPKKYGISPHYLSDEEVENLLNDSKLLEKLE